MAWSGVQLFHQSLGIPGDRVATCSAPGAPGTVTSVCSMTERQTRSPHRVPRGGSMPAREGTCLLVPLSLQCRKFAVPEYRLLLLRAARLQKILRPQHSAASGPSVPHGAPGSPSSERRSGFGGLCEPHTTKTPVLRPLLQGHRSASAVPEVGKE